MSEPLARSELARTAIEVFNAWNAKEFNQDVMNNAVNDLCTRAMRDPRGLVENASLIQFMSAIYYAYNLLYTISASIPNEDLDGYGTWCSQVEEWMGVNDKSNSGFPENNEQIGEDGTDL